MKQKLIALITAIHNQYSVVPQVAKNGMLMLWNPSTNEVSDEVEQALADMDWQHSFRDGDRQFDARLTFSPKPTVEDVASRALAILDK